MTAGFYHTDVSGVLTFDTTPVVENAANTGTSAFTLDASASTVANAFKVPVKAGVTTTANGALGYDATANNVHAAQGSADAIAVLTKVTPGNGNCASWLNSGGTLNLGDAGAPCGGSSGGGGIITYSSSADTFLGTQFLPPGGGAPASSTESDVQVASPAAATVSNLHVEISSALGVGVTAVFTWRDAGSSTTSTCSISGNSAKSCSDTTHSFNAAAGDLLDMQVVTTGTPAAVNVLFTSAFGTSGVGVTLVSASAPLISSGGTTPNISATYQGNGTKVQASTGSTTTDDCVKFDANGNTVDAGAACGSGGSFVLVEEHTASSSAELDFTTCISSSYDDYEIRLLSLVPATNAVHIILQVHTGSGYDTGSNYTWGAFRFTGAASAVTGAGPGTSINVNGGSTMINTAGLGSSGVFRLNNPGSTSGYKLFTGQSQANDGSAYGSITYASYNTTGTAVDGFRVLADSGNISTGTVRCYGIAK